MPRPNISMPGSPLQPHFLRFHRELRLTRAEKATLAQKRDILKRDLRAGLQKIFTLFPTKAPGFQLFHQGSYAMNTGIRPLPGESFDIDVGLRFTINRTDYSDPVLIKRWVYEALNRNYYRQVTYKLPCIRVLYPQKRKTDPLYHVDLAVYGREPYDRYYLAWGKPNSQTSLRYWEAADPLGLRKWIEKRMGAGEQAAQCRRLIAYLKRWKDLRFSAKGNQRPTGIALTIAVCQYFQEQPGNDLLALQRVLQAMISWNSTLKGIYLPLVPNNDLFSKMTHKQRKVLAERLQKLNEQLQQANVALNAGKKEEAIKVLQKAFGASFG